MNQAPGAPRVFVARMGEIPPGKSRKFLLEHRGHEIECFVVNFRGAHHAYVNRCRHVPMSLDWVENRFFDETGELLLCPTHGACYAPDTGECVAGPAFSKHLIRVPLHLQDDTLWAAVPEDFEDVL